MGPLLGGAKLHVVQGRPVVDGVYVNGHGPFRFLVDTATTANHIEPALAQSIGLKATFRTELASSAGVIAALGSDGVEVAIAEERADQQMFLFAGMEAVHQLSRDIQGILGQAFLSRFDYLLDLRGRTITFGKQNRNGSRTRFRMLNGRTAVSTSLGELILDSGAVQLILFHIDPKGGDRRYLRTVAGSQIVGMVSSILNIAGRDVWRGEAVALPAQAEPEVAGLMPLSLFRAIYVSNSEGYVVFE